MKLLPAYTAKDVRFDLSAKPGSQVFVAEPSAPLPDYAARDAR